MIIKRTNAAPFLSGIKKYLQVVGLNLRWFSDHPALFCGDVRAARTSVKNPRDHTAGHIGMWYTLNPEVQSKLFMQCGLNNPFGELCGILGETAIMVRTPAITIMDYIKRSNLNQIPNKYILFDVLPLDGRKGFGKSMTLIHLMHFLHEEEFIIIHVYSPASWCRIFKEILPSTSMEGFYDHTIDGSLYLKHFLYQNGSLLEKLKLTTSQEYQWNVRESTPKGIALAALADFGIQRARYASGVVLAINSELKEYAKNGRCKVSLVIDGINTFFHPVSFFVADNKSVVAPHKFTLFHAFRLFLQPDWINGCIIGTVNIEMSTKDRRKSHLPRYLLRKEGWETLDPFVPVAVNKLTAEEFHNFIDYYVDLNWLQHPDAYSPVGRDELQFMSSSIPGELIHFLNIH